MTPYVIDQKKRQEYFLFLILFTVISFALGYFFGFQNGQPDSDIRVIQSPVVDQSINKDEKIKNASADNKLEKLANKDILSPRNDTKVKTDAKKPLSKKNKTIVNKKSSNKAAKDKPKIKSVSRPKSRPVVEKKNVSIRTDSANKVRKKTTPKSVLNKVQNKTERNNVKGLKLYSVQVGMFASKPNAEKFVNKLKESGFDVYLGDFITSADKKKYNVRLGPYAGRTLAKEKMALYKQNYSNPAYIVINK